MPMIDALPPAALKLLSLATERVTHLEGARTVWHLWGPEFGEPVVLLHGGSGSWTHWIRNIDALAEAGRRILVPDLPGFGDSDIPPGARDADALVAPVARGLQDLLGPRAFDLVGFSFGALVGGLMAARIEDPRSLSIRQLVIVGAPLLTVTGRPLRLLEWRHLDEVAAREVHRANLLTLMLHHPESANALAIDLHRAHVALDRLRRRRLSRTDAMARALAQVPCPVTAIYGEHDALYRERLSEAETLLDALPSLKSRMRIPDAGHWVQFEAPEAFNQALARTLHA